MTALSPIIAMLQTLVLRNWKTTLLGAAGAMQYYQKTQDKAGALTIFFMGFFAKDGNVTGGPAAKTTMPPLGFCRIRYMIALAVVALCLSLGISKAYGQEVTPVPAPVVQPAVEAPLTVKFNDKWSLHLNFGTIGFAYDVTHKQVIGQMAFTGLYVLDYKDLVGVGAGVTFQTGNGTGMTVTGMLASPSLTMSPGLKARIGLLGQFEVVGGDNAFIMAVAPTLQF